MCHAASLKHTLPVAETGDAGAQNGASILDAGTLLSAAGISADFQTSSKLTDSIFHIIDAKLYSWNVIFFLPFLLSAVTAGADLLSLCELIDGLQFVI